MFLGNHNLGCITSWYILLSLVNAQSASASASQATSITTSYSKPDPRTQSRITTTLKLALWNAQLSVISADATATTYFNDHSNPARNNSNTAACHAEAYDRFTLVDGPSTAGFTIIYTECGTNLAASYAYNCPLTAPNTATCDVTYSVGGQIETTTVTQNSSELEGAPCTIYGGIEKLNFGSAAASTTSVSLSPNIPVESTAAPQTTSLLATPSATTTQILPSSSTSAGAGSSFRVSRGVISLAALVASVFLVDL